MGWGVINVAHNSHQYINSGLIKTAATDKHIDRIAVLTSSLKDVLNDYQPQLICIERVFININPKSSLLLGEARGAALAILLTAQVPILEISALQIKQSIVGKGRATKEQVAIMVKKLLSLSSDLKIEHDRIDALACALAGQTAHQSNTHFSSLRSKKRRRGIPTLRELAQAKYDNKH